VDETGVRFSWRDYRDNKEKVMPLEGTEFLRRFCMHILPKRFVYILIEKYTTFSLKSIPLINSNPLLWQGSSNTKQDDKYGYETRDYEALFTRRRQRAENCA
jgi:hypothetical protein